MGKFINKAEASRRKHKQLVHAPFTTNVSNLDDLEAAVTSWPDSYECEITDVSASSDVVTGEFRYGARGANKTDVERRIERSGLRGITLKRASTDRTCKCESGTVSCEEK